MFLLVCRTNNQKPKEKNVVDSYHTLEEAMEALKKECRLKKHQVVYQGNKIAMFYWENQSWIIEIWDEMDYNK